MASDDHAIAELEARLAAMGTTKDHSRPLSARSSARFAGRIQQAQAEASGDGASLDAEAAALESVAPARAARVTLRMIQRALWSEDELTDMSQAEQVEGLQHIETLKLMYKELGAIEGLEMMTELEHLYLQHNRIGRVENLEFHPNLTVLLIYDNALTSLDGLQYATSLAALNASDNSIERVAPGHLPPSLQYVVLAGNPCCAAGGGGGRRPMAAALPRLRELENVAYTREELGGWGMGWSEEREESEDEDKDEDDGGGGEGRESGEGGSAPLELYTLRAACDECRPVAVSDIIGAERLPARIDVEATLDAMEQEAMRGFSERRQRMQEESRQRQRELSAGGRFAASAPTGDVGAAMRGSLQQQLEQLKGACEQVQVAAVKRSGLTPTKPQRGSPSTSPAAASRSCGGGGGGGARPGSAGGARARLAAAREMAERIGALEDTGGEFNALRAAQEGHPGLGGGGGGAAAAARSFLSPRKLPETGLGDPLANSSMTSEELNQMSSPLLERQLLRGSGGGGANL